MDDNENEKDNQWSPMWQEDDNQWWRNRWQVDDNSWHESMIADEEIDDGGW